MIVRARTVVTMDGPPIENGAVRIRGNRIVAVGKFPETAQRPHLHPLAQAEESVRIAPPGDERKAEAAFGDDEVVDLGECVLLPGLINAHCHLDYTCLRGKIAARKSFTDWIRAINAEKANLNSSDYLEAIRIGMDEALRFGTTTLVNFEAFPELIRRSPTTPLRIWWCAELIDVAAPEQSEEILKRALAGLTAATDGRAGRGLAPHALFTVSAALFRRCAEIGSGENLLLSTHLAESAEEMQMFSHCSGPLFDFLQQLGRPMADCGSGTPLNRFFELSGHGGTSAKKEERAQINSRSRWLIVHLNELIDSDFELLNQWRDRISLVHCPRSHAHFRHRRFEFEKLSGCGLGICLGTDSLASNSGLSLFQEMRQFWKIHPEISPALILAMVTLNSAAAIGRSHELGRICAGYLADMTALPVPGSTDVFEAILNFADEVPWMMIDGKTVRGG